MNPPPIVIPPIKELEYYKNQKNVYRKKYEIKDCLEWGFLFYRMKGFVKCQHFLDYIEELCKRSLETLNKFIKNHHFTVNTFKNLDECLDKHHFEINLAAKYGEYTKIRNFTKFELQTVDRIDIIKRVIENRMKIVDYYYRIKGIYRKIL